MSVLANPFRSVSVYSYFSQYYFSKGGYITLFEGILTTRRSLKNYSEVSIAFMIYILDFLLNLSLFCIREAS